MERELKGKPFWLDVHREILAHPFVRRRPPKSTGREDFGESFYAPLFRRYARAKREDVAYTLLAATATILRRSIDRDPAVKRLGVREVLLSGGGAKNPTLVREVTARFEGIPVRVAENGGFSAAARSSTCRRQQSAIRSRRWKPRLACVC